MERMDQNLENHNLGKTNANVKASKRVTKTGQGKSSINCNQCDHKSIKQAQSGSNTSFIILIKTLTDIYG